MEAVCVAGNGGKMLREYRMRERIIRIGEKIEMLEAVGECMLEQPREGGKGVR